MKIVTWMCVFKILNSRRSLCTCGQYRVTCYVIRSRWWRLTHPYIFDLRLLMYCQPLTVLTARKMLGMSSGSGWSQGHSDTVTLYGGCLVMGHLCCHGTSGARPVYLYIRTSPLTLGWKGKLKWWFHNLKTCTYPASSSLDVCRTNIR